MSNTEKAKIYDIVEAKVISPQVIQAFIAAWKDIFGLTATPSTTDSTQLFRSCRDMDAPYSLAKLIKGYKDIEQQIIGYPFCKPLRETIDLFETWLDERDPLTFFIRVTNDKDRGKALFDKCKEVVQFTHDQLPTYKQLLRFLDDNQYNFPFVPMESQDAVTDFCKLKDAPWPITGLCQYLWLKDQLAVSLDAVRNGLREKIRTTYNDMFDYLQQVAQQQGVPVSVLSDREAILLAKTAPDNILVLQRNINTYAFYQEQIERIMTYVPPRASGSDRPTKCICQASLQTKTKLPITNEEDIDHYLECTYEPVIPDGDKQPEVCSSPCCPRPNTKRESAPKSTPSFWSRLFGMKRPKALPSQEGVIVKNNTCSTQNRDLPCDEVYSSVFAPADVKKGTNMLVQVFLHTAKHEERVQSIASQADKNAEKRGYTPLSCKMQKGDKADVELNIYDKKLLKNERKSIIWNGEFTQCSFRHFIDEGMAADNLYCEVNIYVNGAPVGCTSFLTDIVAHEARNIYAKPDATRFEKIFVSYSHQDYDRVKYLVQGFRAQGIDYFFDRHNLRSGDVYSERIFEYIDKADLFMLCWSANAQKSEYVKKEIERALSHVYPQVARDSETLKIRPISIEPRADLPSSIRNIYHIEEL